MSEIIKRFRAYPFALKALLVALVVIAAYLLWHDVVWATAKEWNDRADEYEAAVAAAAGRRSLRDSSTDLINAHGDIELPGPVESSRADLDRAVHETLQKHSITGYRVTPKTGARFRKGALAGVVRSNQQAVQLINEIKFDATPDVAIRVIADLEAHPAVEAVRKVALGKGVVPSVRTVTVNLTVEAWAVPGALPSRPISAQAESAIPPDDAAPIETPTPDPVEDESADADEDADEDADDEADEDGNDDDSDDDDSDDDTDDMDESEDADDTDSNSDEGAPS